MKVLYFALLLGAGVITSCKTDLEPQESSAVAESTAATAGPTQSATSPAVEQTNSNVTYQQTGTQTLNPAHGQPGHRCEVAVGAPLPNSGGASQLTPPTTTTSTQQITPQMLTAGAPKSGAPMAKGMNPAHGQPGHRCDIAVGAPLNGTAATPAAGGNPVTMTPAIVNSDGTITPGAGTNIKTTTTNNAAPAMLKAPTGTASGTNPAHGQPGHVCSVAVGEPLPN